MTKFPTNQHVTYALQYRKCGKPTCGTCKKGAAHGPYFYAYWRDPSAKKQRVAYLGKQVSPEIEAAFARQQARKGAA